MAALSRYIILLSLINVFPVFSFGQTDKKDTTGIVANSSGSISALENQGNFSPELAANPQYWELIAGSFGYFRNFLGVDLQPITNYSWTVPAGVTSILVELWGGGSGNKDFSGGQGGGYTLALLPVSPGMVLEIAVGGGGRGDLPSTDRNGQTTTLSALIEGVTRFVNARGGGTGSTGTISWQTGAYGYTLPGLPGTAVDAYFSRKSLFTNTRVYHCGDGGGVIGYPWSGGAGSSYIFPENSSTLDRFSNGSSGAIPGGGAGGQSNSNLATVNHVNHGGAGMVLIRW
jgi:hypothetical protein